MTLVHHRTQMTRLLLIFTIGLIVIRPDLGVIASINPAQEAAADTFCQVHGCGDLAPMDDIDA